jgi:hypothetical protein
MAVRIQLGGVFSISKSSEEAGLRPPVLRHFVSDEGNNRRLWDSKIEFWKPGLGISQDACY